MSTSDKGSARHTFFWYLGVSLFCIVFRIVYERFSHGVKSVFMIGLFSFPLLLGALPAALLWRLPRANWPTVVVRNLWHSAVATLSVGSCLQAVVEIYGTTAPLIRLYWLIGGMLLVIAVIKFVVQQHKNQKQ